MLRQKGAKTIPGACKQAAQSAASKGAISMLQEFVQWSQALPSNYSVLQWTFESQMADSATLEFRAIVAFLHEGVPHHIVGIWQAKKKDAQRDAAERALSLFVGRWSAQIDEAMQKPLENAKLSSSEVAESPGCLKAACALCEQELVAERCRTLDTCSIPPCWSLHWEADACRATVEMSLCGVPHQFVGAAESSEVAACVNTARRVLWYLQCPGFQDAFEPDPLSLVATKLPPPPAAWAHDSVVEGALKAAERKTAIMRVQNRLQQQFSRDLPPGSSVWAWTYEMDPNDADWPPLCRATASIPVIGETFVGDWVRGQREAQLDTIRHVTDFLDKL